MAKMTADFPNGNCDNIVYFDDRIECTPVVPAEMMERGTTNHLHDWSCLLIGQAEEKVNLVIHWPPFDVDKIDKANNEYWYVQSFGEVVKDTFHCSADLLHWTRITDVKKVGWDLFLTVTIPAGGKLYITTNVLFTNEELEAVCKEFAEYRVFLCENAVKCDVPMFRFGNGKRAIWLQANQHVKEMSGCHALVGAMRYLVQHKEEWKDFSFFIVPTVIVRRFDGLYEEPMRKENINRNWGHIDQPETIAIDGFIRKLVADGYEMLVMTDMHNGWCRADDSGGNYTEYTRGFIEDSYWHRRLRFSRALLRTIDYERPDKIWWSDFAEIKTFFQYGSQNYHALCSTMEFSRFKLWNQEKQCYVPQTQEGLERMGEQYAEFLLHYDYDTVEEFTENDYFGKSI